MSKITDYSFLFQSMSGTSKTNVMGNFQLSQLNSSAIQAQLKAAGIDTSSKQYQAVMQSMSAACKGVGYTNIQAIKNRMSRYDSDGDYISPVTGLAGLVVTEKNRAEKERIIPIPESSKEEMFELTKQEFLRENGIANGDTTKRSDVYLNLYRKMDKNDRLAAGNTLRQYEQAYTQAFVNAVKAVDPKWKPGKPIPAGALDGVTREAVENQRKSVDMKI